MLPTFVIGLREGLEAALIVGIVAAFLRKQGRADLVRWVLVGVFTAVMLCLAAGIALRIYSSELPQRQQEGLETVIGALAVGMVTYMVVWMKRNSRNLKGQLEGLAADAMHGSGNGGRAMVLMAFLAVIREGLETVVFLLAAFNEAGSSESAGFGALLGILLAVALGYGIYRGGVRLNLSKFFRATGLVLVLVAAGLVVNALHTAHEAGWLDAGQSSTVDLTWLVKPGSVQASLLTGMLGIQPSPVLIEVIGWLVYLVPVGIYVAWPPGRGLQARTSAKVCAAGAVVLAALAAVFALVRPGTPDERPVTASSSGAVQVVGAGHGTLAVREGSRTLQVHAAGGAVHGDVDTRVYRGNSSADASGAGPATLAVGRVAALNGHRLPLNVTPGPDGTLGAHYRSTTTTTVWLAVGTDRVLDLRSVSTVTVSVDTADGSTAPLTTPLSSDTRTLTPAQRSAAAAAAAHDADLTDTRSALGAAAVGAAVLAGLALLAAAGFALAARRRPVEPVRTSTPAGQLVKS